MAFGPGGNNATTINNTITVHPLPFAAFSINDSLLSLGDPFAIFVNNSTGGYTYIWDFGDGNASIDLQPWHEYSSSGSYDVQLIVQSQHCGNDTLIKNDFVHINTGLPEPSSGSIKVLGNTIQFKEGIDLKEYTIRLYDIQSKLIKQWDKVYDNRIDVNPYLKDRAIYFLMIRGNSEILIKETLLKK